MGVLRCRTARAIASIGVAVAAAAASVGVAVAAPAPAEAPPVPSAGCRLAPPPSGETPHLFAAAGRSGDYLQDVPRSKPGAPLPLVFDMHGYLQPAVMQHEWSGLGTFALQHGFISIAPEVTGLELPQWDTSRGSKDIGYISALLTHVEQTLCIDKRRVYMAGLSMGAFMTSSVACQLSDRFAAVAPVAGLQNFPWCHPTRPVPAVAFHGDADPILAYTGGVGPIGKMLPASDGSLRTAGAQAAADPLADKVPRPESIPDQTSGWARRNGCGARPTTQRVSCDVTRAVYSCAPDATVELYTVHGGGHTWPGGDTTTVPAPVVGKVTSTISADQIMWDFFRAHPLRGQVR